MSELGFFFCKIEYDDGSCSSQILLDGTYVTLDSLCCRRESAVLEIYPCQGSCCAGVYPTDIVHKIPPLKLKIVLAHVTYIPTMQFFLSRGHKNLQKHEEEVRADTEATLMRLDVVAKKTSGIVSVSMSLDSVYSRTIQFQDDLHSHSAHEICEYLGLSSPGSGTVPVKIDLCRWTSINLFGSPHCIKTGEQLFDDRVPTVSPEGELLWRGLEQSSRIKLRGLKTWSVGGMIVGLQVLYLVDNAFRPSPRQLHWKHIESGHIDHMLLSGSDTVCQVAVILSAHGRCSHIALRTSQGIHHTLGSINPMPHRARQVLVNLKPSSQIVAFRGAFCNFELSALGIVVEHLTWRPYAVFYGLPRRCMVCGAARSVFSQSELFDKHVADCHRIQSPATRLHLLIH